MKRHKCAVLEGPTDEKCRKQGLVHVTVPLRPTFTVPNSKKMHVRIWMCGSHWEHF